MAGVAVADGVTAATVETRVDGKAVASERLAASADGITREAINTDVLIPPLPLLKYPVRAGDTWAVAGVAGKQRLAVAVTVGKAEEVVVPAGKYQPVRVDIAGTIDGVATDATYWFAQDVGVVKLRYEVAGNDASLELKAFTPGKD